MFLYRLGIYSTKMIKNFFLVSIFFKFCLIKDDVYFKSTNRKMLKTHKMQKLTKIRKKECLKEILLRTLGLNFTNII